MQDSKCIRCVRSIFCSQVGCVSHLERSAWYHFVAYLIIFSDSVYLFTFSGWFSLFCHRRYFASSLSIGQSLWPIFNVLSFFLLYFFFIISTTSTVSMQKFSSIELYIQMILIVENVWCAVAEWHSICRSYTDTHTRIHILARLDERRRCRLE